MELKQPIVEPVVPKVRTFVTARNSDRSEGRGHTVFERYFDDVDEAIDAARRIDVQGMVQTQNGSMQSSLSIRSTAPVDTKSILNLRRSMGNTTRT